MTSWTNLRWRDYSSGPLIEPPFPDWILADPSILTSEESPDGLWHLFAHGIFGLYHYTSVNGISWKKLPKPIVLMGFRPWIFKENGTYYLFYEKIIISRKFPLAFNFPFYNSHIEIKESKDLVHWGRTRKLVVPTLPWHKTPPSKGNIGNPCLLKVGQKYRLYYSAGLIYLPDCKFCEPRYVGIAEAENIYGPYNFHPEPMYKGLEDVYTNISASASRVYPAERAMKVYPHKNGFLGLQTCIFRDEKTMKSTGVLRLTKSSDGINWETIGEPIIKPNKPWKKSHVYVGDLKKFGNELRIYYNARNGWLFGKERIGMAVANIDLLT